MGVNAELQRYKNNTVRSVYCANHSTVGRRHHGAAWFGRIGFKQELSHRFHVIGECTMAQNPKQTNKVARAASSGMRNARFSAAADTAAARARALRAQALENKKPGK